ncbi:MAG: NAD-dependent deacylase [Phycisphaeraceae bacterium]|nr:NAD-dependent deacylase [Phycisphaeraceae bacterium]
MNDESSTIEDHVEGLEHAARRLSRAACVVVVTGAGASAESGIPTFRDTMQSLWKEFDPQKLATPEAFDANPEVVTRWYDHRRLGCLAAQPNPGHGALATLEQHLADRGGEFALFTQNVDRLHQRAGSRRVYELHGSILEWRCASTGHVITPPPTPFEAFPPPSPFQPGALLRPNVVWFGEALPEEALRAAWEVTPRCDVFLTVGTSSQVYPAAGFVDIASQAGAFTIEVNKDPTPASRRVDVVLRGTVGRVLPLLVSRAFGPGVDGQG